MNKSGKEVINEPKAQSVAAVPKPSPCLYQGTTLNFIVGRERVRICVPKSLMLAASRVIRNKYDPAFDYRNERYPETLPYQRMYARRVTTVYQPDHPSAASDEQSGIIRLPLYDPKIVKMATHYALTGILEARNAQGGRCEFEGFDVSRLKAFAVFFGMEELNQKTTELLKGIYKQRDSVAEV